MEYGLLPMMIMIFAMGYVQMKVIHKDMLLD